MGLLDWLTGKAGKQKLKDALSRGAIVVDVRTVGEFDGGHIRNSKNIPLDRISSRITEIKKWNKPVICVCASGMRSGQAKSILANNGIEAYNGGSWAYMNGLI